MKKQNKGLVFVAFLFTRKVINLVDKYFLSLVKLEKKNKLNLKAAKEKQSRYC